MDLTSVNTVQLMTLRGLIIISRMETVCSQNGTTSKEVIAVRVVADIALMDFLPKSEVDNYLFVVIN